MHQDPTEVAAFLLECKKFAWLILMDEMCALTLWLAEQLDANGFRFPEFQLVAQSWVFK